LRNGRRDHKQSGKEEGLDDVSCVHGRGISM
jgi:hypothetical protein